MLQLATQVANANSALSGHADANAAADQVDAMAPATPSGMRPIYTKPNGKARKKRPGRKPGHAGAPCPSASIEPSNIACPVVRTATVRSIVVAKAARVTSKIFPTTFSPSSPMRYRIRRWAITCWCCRHGCIMESARRCRRSSMFSASIDNYLFLRVDCCRCGIDCPSCCATDPTGFRRSPCRRAFYTATQRAGA